MWLRCGTEAGAESLIGDSSPLKLRDHGSGGVVAPFCSAAILAAGLNGRKKKLRASGRLKSYAFSPDS
jgi:hypothetical protein